jgi:hypothetical protein
MSKLALLMLSTAGLPARVLAASVGLLAASLAHAPVASEPPTITFFVASDSHFGALGMDELNRSIVEQMNSLPGSEYPPQLGGRVDTPRGVLFTGDTTDNGTLEEFAEFEKVYGLTGKDGLLKYPVFESIGNHDVNSESPIKQRAKQRHGGINYWWDWDDVRFLCLDMYPDAATNRWLTQQLQQAGPERPLVLFFHYSLGGRWSRFWTEEEKEAFAQTIEAYNVIAIFHGHEHSPGHYIWKERPVFKPGAPRHSRHFFLVVRLGPRQIEVASWNFDTRSFQEVWVAPVRRFPMVATPAAGAAGQRR